jgi:hypothetical protein
MGARSLLKKSDTVKEEGKGGRKLQGCGASHRTLRNIGTFGTLAVLIYGA